jgi:C-terminal processing protease CtpA/Prc
VKRGRPPGVPLAEFVAKARELDLGTRLALIDTAICLLDEVYVHLPQKRARYGVDPVQQLRFLRTRVDELGQGEFRDELTTVFTSLHDRHTGYLAPEPWADRAAALPFLVERYVTDGRARFIVSKVADDWGPVPPSFEHGVEVVEWSGVPIERAVERNALRQRGANPAARTARGLQALTVRSLRHSVAPDEHWVDVGYRTKRGSRQEARFVWRVIQLDETLRADEAGPLIGNDPAGVAVQQVRKELFATSRQTSPWIETSLPNVLSARPWPVRGGGVGYLRIWSFSELNDAAFVAEFSRLVGLLPTRGLVIDIRGNPGGSIRAAERILRRLTDRPVEPARFSLATGRATLAMCQADRELLGAWEASIEAATGTGDVYSQGLPVTPVEESVGRAYPGPSVVITDALTYSAADLFAAGFQDNAIGPVLGTARTTGGGGANVWTARQVEALLGDLEGGWPILPPGAGSFTLAFRRATRVGSRAGLPLEDIGVEVEQVHALTRDDLLRSNRDLIRVAAAHFPQSR